MPEFKHCSLILECGKCEMINYLDPFTFWFFAGKVKCAGCGAIWRLEIDNGHRVSGPTEDKPPHDKLPGYAQSKDYKIKITDRTKVNLPEMARKEFIGRPIPIYNKQRQTKTLRKAITEKGEMIPWDQALKHHAKLFGK